MVFGSAILIPFNQTIEIFGISRTLSFYLCLLTLLVGGHAFLIMKNKQPSQNWYFSIFLLIGSPIILSSLLHWDMQSKSQQIFLFNFGWSLMAVSLVIRRRQLFLIMNGFLFGLCVLIIFSLIQGEFSRSPIIGRLSVSGKNPNDLSAELLIGINFLIFMIIQTKKSFLMWFYVTVMSALNYLIIETGSRFSFYAILLIAIGLIVLIFFINKDILRKKLIIIVLSILVSSLSFSFMNSGFGVRLLDFDASAEKVVIVNDKKFVVKEQDDSNLNLGGRVGAWQHSFVVFKENWLYGVGDSSFQKLTSENKIDSPHNFIFYSAAVGGIVSLMPALGFLILITFLIIRYSFVKQRPEIAIIFGSNLVILMMLNVFYLKVFWLSLSISIVACMLDKKELISKT